MQTDGGMCAASVARGAAIAAIRSRVTQNVGGWLTDTACVQVALATTLRSPDDLLEFLLKPADAKRAIVARSAIALKSDEFRSLFGTGASPTRTNNLKETMEDATFQQHVRRVGTAMRCSLGETNQSKIWTSGWSKAVLVVAMHMNDYDSRLADVLGSVVRGDARRIEDVASEIDEGDLSTVMLSQATTALAYSVT